MLRETYTIDEDIQWKQWFMNYKKALVNLIKTVEWAKTADSLTEKIVNNHYLQFLAFAEKMGSMN
jgi:hypothetical protein